MGQWGDETFSCDSVMDFLQHYLKDGDLDKMTKKMANMTLADVWATGENFDKLGVVTWLLTQAKFVVPDDKLQIALAYANDELHPSNLGKWGDQEARKKMINLEMGDIRYALEHDGKGRKREAKSLPETVMEYVENLSNSAQRAWLLKWDDREELDQQVISSDLNKLKAHMDRVYDEPLTFHDRGDIIFVQAGKGKKNREVAILAKVQVV